MIIRVRQRTFFRIRGARASRKAHLCRLKPNSEGSLASVFLLVFARKLYRKNCLQCTELCPDTGMNTGMRFGLVHHHEGVVAVLLQVSWYTVGQEKIMERINK